MSITCPKCGYPRKPVETVPDWQCPQCGVAYSKVGAAPAGSRSPQAARPSPRPVARSAMVNADELQPIKSAPSLMTINGFGFKLYGRDELDLDGESYMTTHYLVVLFLPLIPLARYRVIRDGNHYAFLGKGRLRTMDKVHLGISALLILCFFLANRSR